MENYKKFITYSSDNVSAKSIEMRINVLEQRLDHEKEVVEIAPVQEEPEIKLAPLEEVEPDSHAPDSR